MKSAIRKEIEKILRQNHRISSGFIDSRVNGYRLKLCTPASCMIYEKEAILALPHVTKVGYSYGDRTSGRSGYYKGISIYFDKRPKDIKIPSKNQEWSIGILPFEKVPFSGIPFEELREEINPEVMVQMFLNGLKATNPIKDELEEIRNRIDKILHTL